VDIRHHNSIRSVGLTFCHYGLSLTPTLSLKLTTWIDQFLPCVAMRCTVFVFVIVILSVCLSVTLVDMATRQLSGDTTVNDLGHISRSLDCFTSIFWKKKNGEWYSKIYYRLLIGNRTLAFDWCHIWWPWSTFEGHFSLGCHFHVHFSNPRQSACFRVARSPSNSWASCFTARRYTCVARSLWS